MAVRMPDRPTPIGCLVGFFALIAASFSAMAFWGASKAFSKEPPAVDTGKKLILWGIIALFPAMICFIYFVSKLVNCHRCGTQQIGKSLSS